MKEAPFRLNGTAGLEKSVGSRSDCMSVPSEKGSRKVDLAYGASLIFLSGNDPVLFSTSLLYHADGGCECDVFHKSVNIGIFVNELWNAPNRHGACGHP